MPNAHKTVTPEEFKEVKKRIEKLETILEVSNIEKIRDDVHEMDKEQATISEKIDSLDAKIDAKIDLLDNKIDLKFDSLRTEMRTENNSLRTEMNERFNTTNEKINTTNEKINSVRTELRITLGLILTGIVAIIIKLFI